MSRLQSLSCLSLAIVLVLGAGAPAGAIPVDGLYTEDPRCDTVPDIQLTHEIGETAAFPIDELIFADALPTTTICVGDDGITNDWEVRITNLSPFPYVDLFFVVDGGGTVGNADGTIADLSVAGSPAADAFRIDGTVTVTGLNDNLLFESMTVDEIFEPGESWSFLVTNFMPGALLPPVFDSPAAFAGTSAGTSPSTASILARQVPEPSSALLIGLGCAGVALLRRRTAR